MQLREQDGPGATLDARIEKDGENWTLVLVRELAHPLAKVWAALTDPAQLARWAPYDADRNLGQVGTATLTTVGAPTPTVSESTITRADAPRALELTWGGNVLRWGLDALGGDRTRLTLWHAIDRNYIALGAAGWDVCLDVLDRVMRGEDAPRTVGMQALQSDKWKQRFAAYSKKFNVPMPSWGGDTDGASAKGTS